MKKLNSKTKLFILLLLFATVVFASVKLTSAWLTDSGSSSSTTITVGKVDYTMTLVAPEGFPEKIVPGQALIGTGTPDTNVGYTLAITNASTVDSQFRISKILVTIETTGDVTTKINAITGMTVGSDGNDTEVTSSLVKLPDSFTNWYSNGGYLYYGSNSANTGEVTVGTSSLTVSDLVLTLDGASVGNSYAGATITVLIEFQAKQADYVTWETSGLSFEVAIS